MNDKIYDLLVFLDIMDEQDIHLARYDGGALPGRLQGNNLVPYGNKDTFMTYYFTPSESIVFGNKLMSTIEIQIDVFGDEAYKILNNLKIKLANNGEYLNKQKIGLISPSPSTIDGNVLINNIWYNRKIINLQINVEEELEIKEDEIATFGDTHIKVV